METVQKIYLPFQLKALFTPEMYKVMDVLFGFQKEGIISYSKRNCEFLHMPQEVVEKCVQTAVDRRLIEPVELAGGVYRFRINASTIEGYRQVALSQVSDGTPFKLSEEITFREIGKKGGVGDIKSLSNEEILHQLNVLKEQLAKNLRGDDNDKFNDLPW